MKSIHVVLSTIVVAIIVLASALVNYSEAEPVDVARFVDVSILGKGEMIDGMTVIREGYFATITLDVEKLSAAPIEDIMIRTSLTNSDNGDALLIDNAIMYATLNMEQEDYLKYSDGKKTDPFQGTDKTGVMMINVSAVDASGSDIEDTVNLVLYADGVEMDRLSFDVIVKNKAI